MKISCKVIEDMLPIYYDGVCSNESAALVEEHLRDCTDCSKLFTEFRSEIMIQGN
ncbi:MAG: zf-HC2 domain-containing protein, partial [Oscillospiraceae bacterium]|nr:zf-HC2 domain-containing protein [Oscillospiraceae bacterium]